MALEGPPGVTPEGLRPEVTLKVTSAPQGGNTCGARIYWADTSNPCPRRGLGYFVWRVMVDFKMLLLTLNLILINENK